MEFGVKVLLQDYEMNFRGRTMKNYLNEYFAFFF